MQGLNTLVGVLGLIILILGPLIRFFRNPESRQRIKCFFREARAKLGGIFSSNQKERYRKMRVCQLKSELRKLVLFRRGHEMDSLRTVFSSLASAGSSALYLCFCVALAALFFLVVALIVLEGDIQHHPVIFPQPTTGQILSVRLFEVLVFALVGITTWNIGRVQTEADKLSPTFRKRRIDKIKERLEKYGEDPDKILRELKQSRQESPAASRKTYLQQ
jgi:hypothetical protein